ncbi:MAG: BPSS1780 family membrane protein [Pseudomonadota bacterium]
MLARQGIRWIMTTAPGFWARIHFSGCGMHIRRVEAGQGIVWVQTGWAGFMRLPGLWILLTLVFLAIIVILSLIPYVGSLIVALIGPVLGAGALEAARRTNRGENFAIGILFDAFSRNAVLNDLLVLGAVSLAMNALIMGIGAVCIGSSMLGMGMMHGEGGALVGVGLGALIGLPMVLTLHALLSAGLFFAVPLVMEGRASPLTAMQDSLKACWVNWAALLLFSIVVTILSVLAMISMGLGFLVLGPVLTCAVWAAYAEIFPAEPALAQLSEPVS